MRGVPTLTPPLGVGPDRGAFGRSFDFSEFPRLKEVKFFHLVSQMHRGRPWIPMALSTLSPTTSPHLSSLQLAFIGSLSDLSPQFLIEDMGNVLQRIADQVTRIKCEFEGAVDSTVIQDPKFESVLRIRFPM